MAADFLCGCGLSTTSAAPRCRACPQAGTTPSTALLGTSQGSTPSQPPLVRYSRWEKSSGTFGPFGRLFTTFLLLVPLPVFAMTFAIGIGIIGAGIYIVVIMPWALRDIWKKATIRLDMPTPTSAGPRFL